MQIFFSFFIAILLTFVGSRWIDFLYKLPDAPLTFPEKISSRAKFRKPLLTIILFVCFLNLQKFSAPPIFYLTAAIFFLALIIFTDFEQYIIFDKMLLPFALIGVAAIIHLNLPIFDRIIAAIFGGGIFFLLSILSRGGIGGGDIKLVATLGIWLGTEKLLNVVLISCIFAGICAVILILTQKKDRKDFFAYGPYFAMSTIFILLR